MYEFCDYDDYDYALDMIDSGFSLEDAARPWEVWGLVEEAIDELYTHSHPVRRSRRKKKNKKQSTKPNATERTSEVLGDGAQAQTSQGLPSKSTVQQQQQKHSREKSSKKKRSAFIRIVPAAGRSYADVFYAVRIPALMSVEDQIRGLRRIDGDMMLVRCKRDADCDAIVSRIKVALGELGTVVVLTPQQAMHHLYDISDDDDSLEDDLIDEYLESRQNIVSKPGMAEGSLDCGELCQKFSTLQRDEATKPTSEAAAASEETLDPASTILAANEGGTEQLQTSEGGQAKAHEERSPKKPTTQNEHHSQQIHDKKRCTAETRIVPAAGPTFSDVSKAISVPVLCDVADQIEPPRRIEAALVEFGTVVLSPPMTVVIVPNLDLMTSAEAVQSAIMEQLGVTVDTGNIQMRCCQNGLMLARIRLPTREATKIVGKRLTVAHSVVRVKEEDKRYRRVPAWCYRCMEPGHISRACKGTDLSHLCFRCGGEGHRSFGCRAPPKCLKCGSGHPTGSPQCTFGVQTRKQL
uniref:CCHC-type domain-containing protein n=1 Tax=Anopheles farauti TaxID=69004 RepID=A0A182QTM3_9DIPT